MWNKFFGISVIFSNVYVMVVMRVRFRRVLFVMVVVFAMLFGGVTALADSFIAPEPAVVESEDGAYVFSFNPDNDGDFPEMGVYLDFAGRLELVYLIPFGYMTFLSDFYFSSDMRYMVHFPTITQDTVLFFYDNGELMESYRIPNLVGDKSVVSYSVSMASWYDFNSRMLDSDNNTFAVTTNDGLSYVFDITTGKVIEGDIIITDEVWSPFNIMEEEPPKTPNDIFTVDDFEFDLSDHITDSSPVDLPLDCQVVTNIITGTELVMLDAEQPDVIEDSPMDVALIIGIVVMVVCVAGLGVMLVLFVWKKKS